MALSFTPDPHAPAWWEDPNLRDHATPSDIKYLDAMAAHGTHYAAAGFVNFVISTGVGLELVLEIAMAVARAAVRPLHTADGAGAESVLVQQPINKQMVRYI